MAWYAVKGRIIVYLYTVGGAKSHFYLTYLAPVNPLIVIVIIECLPVLQETFT